MASDTVRLNRIPFTSISISSAVSRPSIFFTRPPLNSLRNASESYSYTWLQLTKVSVRKPLPALGERQGMVFGSVAECDR